VSDTVIEVKCRHCLQVTKITVDTVRYVAWKRKISGALIQDILPDVSRDHREMLMSKICPDCWNSIFGEEES